MSILHDLSLDLDEVNCDSKEDDVSPISIENELNKPIPSEILDNHRINRQK